MPLAGKVGAIYIQTTDAPVAFADEATTANADYTRYTITNVSKRYWDKNTAITIKKNGITITTGFTIEYAGGVVVFSTPNIDTDVIVVSGAYLTVAQVGGFFNWSVEPESDTTDVTTFGSNGWKETLPTLKGFSGSAERYWLDGSFIDRLGSEVVVVLYVDAGVSKYRYEGFALISGDSIEDPVDDVINETLEIQGTGQLYYREG